MKKFGELAKAIPKLAQPPQLPYRQEIGKVLVLGVRW